MFPIGCFEWALAVWLTSLSNLYPVRWPAPR
jgi:hypothetical protein